MTEILKNTIEIGLEKPIKVLHITDSHILPKDEIVDDYKKWLVSRFGVTREDTLSALNEQLAYGKEHCDLILYTGDLIDFVTKESMAFARDFVKDDKIVFAIGNHDYVEIFGSNWILMDHERVTGADGLDMKGAFFHSRVYGGVNFVALDNSNHQAEDWQTELLKKEAEKGFPIVLLLHVPLFEEALYQYCMECFKDSAYILGCDDEHMKTYPERRIREQKPTEASKRFLEYVNQEPLIKAAVTGHLHFNFESTLPGGAVQYVTDIGFNNVAREITII